MAEKLKNVFIDYAAKLQSYLDIIAPNTFICFNEKDTNYEPEDSNYVYIAVSKLTGQPTRKSVTLPIMLKFYTLQDPNTVIGTFIGLSKAKAQTSYRELVETEPDTFEEATIFESIGTPAVSQYNVEFGSDNHWTELVAFCTLTCLFDVGNIKTIVVNGETLDILSGNFAYAAELFSNRQSGQKQNKAKKKASTTTCSLTMINQTSPFTTKALDIMFGKIDGNEIFTANIELINGYKVEGIKLIISQINFNFNIQTPSLPSLNIIMTLGDDRGQNNA